MIELFVEFLEALGPGGTLLSLLLTGVVDYYEWFDWPLDDGGNFRQMSLKMAIATEAVLALLVIPKLIFYCKSPRFTGSRTDGDSDGVRRPVAYVDPWGSVSRTFRQEGRVNPSLSRQEVHETVKLGLQGGWLSWVSFMVSIFVSETLIFPSPATLCLGTFCGLVGALTMWPCFACCAVRGDGTMHDMKVLQSGMVSGALFSISLCAWLTADQSPLVMLETLFPFLSAIYFSFIGGVEWTV